MNKEVDPVNSELGELASTFMDTFIQRRDLYAKQLDDGSYICIKKPLTQKHIIAHLNGELTLGTYVLDEKSQAHFLVFDADDDRQYQELVSAIKVLENGKAPVYLESSRRGGHLWMFFSQPIPGKTARKFGNEMAKKYNLQDMELFPKQDHLQSGPGSLIRLPFGIHRRTGERYGFLNSSLKPLATTQEEQIRLLTNPDHVRLEFILLMCGDSKNKIMPIPDENPNPIERMALSNKIKGSISVYDFVKHYVKLTPAGQGKCPFHDDKVSSFAVNADGNYWHCFAGCGGGSIIDFWMKYRRCDFTKAVKELARMVLKSG